MTDPDHIDVVPGALLHEHTGRQVLVNTRWLHLLWADAEDNGELLRIRTAETGRGYLVRSDYHQVRGAARPATFHWAANEREGMDLLLNEMDRHVTDGDLESAANALEHLAIYARRCAVKLHQQLEVNTDRWDNEPADGTAG